LKDSSPFILKAKPFNIEAFSIEGLKPIKLKAKPFNIEGLKPFYSEGKNPSTLKPSTLRFPALKD
jgi:hypothetical protein